LINEIRLYNITTFKKRIGDNVFNSYVTKTNTYYRLNDNMINLLNTNLKTVTLPNITMETYETNLGSSLKITNPNGVIKTSEINMTFRYDKNIHKLFYYTIIYGMFNEFYIPYVNAMSYFIIFSIYS
jgi:hypothetical protein